MVSMDDYKVLFHYPRLTDPTYRLQVTTHATAKIKLTM
jgi:hypothetical protein